MIVALGAATRIHNSASQLVQVWIESGEDLKNICDLLGLRELLDTEFGDELAGIEVSKM